MNIRSKLSFVVVLTMLVTSIPVMTGMIDRARELLLREATANLLQSVAVKTLYLKQSPKVGTENLLEAGSGLWDREHLGMIFDADGNLVSADPASGGIGDRLAAYLNQLRPGPPQLLTSSLEWQSRRYLLLGALVEPAAVRYVELAPVEPILEPLDRIRNTVFYGLLVLCLLCAALVAISADWMVVSRVKVLARAIRKSSSFGQRQAAIQVSGSDEITGLAREFDTLTARVDQHFQELQFANASLRKTEARLRENGAQLRFLLEHSPTAVRIASRDERRVLFANASYAQLLNLPAEQVLNVDPAHYYRNPEEYAELVARIGVGDRIENRLVELDIPGRGHRSVLASYLGVRYENKDCILGWFVNVSELLKAEETERLHASVFESCGEGIIITDANNKILGVNRAFSEITGFEEVDILGKNPSILNSGRQSKGFYRQMWEAISTQGQWRGEVWNRRRNGEIYPELLTISRVLNSAGEVTHYVGIFSDISELKQNQKLLERMAHFDALTRLPNRTLLSDRLEQALATSKRNDTILAVCLLDLDGFKPVNDRYGHVVGDSLLIEVAHRLESVLREDDTVARLGGDEFVLLLAGLTHTDELDAVLERIIAIVNETAMIENQPVKVSASIGVALHPQDDADADTLIRHADMAMYEAKQLGRNRYHLFDSTLDREMHDRHAQLERLSQALSARELCLYYQPKVNLVTGQVLGVEALLRWQHPQRGLLGPLEFLPLAESHDLIIEIGDWVLNEALSQLQEWQRCGLRLQVSVNLAARQIQDANFSKRLRMAMQRHPEVVGRALELEILETSALQTDAIAQIVREVGDELNVTFALDDFGTGYSSLAYLKQLPASTLKIDQSFVRDMLEDMEDQAIVKGVIEMARVFRRSVVAEGVETEQHAMRLLELGCEIVQGYGISRPLPADQVGDWVTDYLSRPITTAV